MSSRSTPSSRRSRGSPGAIEKPDGRQVVSSDGDHRRACAPASDLWRDPAGSRSERPRRIGDGPGDRQIGMRERQRRVAALTPQRDRKGSVVDGHRSIATRRLTCGRSSSPMPSRVQLARTSAAVTGVPSEKRAFSRNVTIQVRPFGVEPPGRGQAGTHTSVAVDADQRLVELTEQQSLALVRRVRCVRRIDAVARGRRSQSVRPVRRSARSRALPARDAAPLPQAGRRAVLAWRQPRPRARPVGPALARRALPPAGCASCTPRSSPEGTRRTQARRILARVASRPSFMIAGLSSTRSIRARRAVAVPPCAKATEFRRSFTRRRKGPPYGCETS